MTSNYSTHRMTGRVRGIWRSSNNIGENSQVLRTPKHAITIGSDTLIALRPLSVSDGRLLMTLAANGAPFREGQPPCQRRANHRH